MAGDEVPQAEEGPVQSPGTGDLQVAEGNTVRTHLSLTLSGNHCESWAEAPAGFLGLLY